VEDLGRSVKVGDLVYYMGMRSSVVGPDIGVVIQIDHVNSIDLNLEIVDDEMIEIVFVLTRGGRIDTWFGHMTGVLSESR